MTPVVLKYPQDLTGRSPDNLISDEPHTLYQNTEGSIRAFAPHHGAFYTADILIRDSNGVELTPYVDYIATYLHEELTTKSGLEVCAVVLIINPGITSNITMTYQVVGGEYSISADALQQVLDTLTNSEGPIEWAGIIGKPNEYVPGGHLHALWELYGFEYLVTQLERVNQSILTGDQAQFDEIRAYAYRLYLDGKLYTDALDVRFQNHVNDLLNPHRVTKTQVQLGSVANYPMASDAEATGSSSTRYMSPRTTQIAISDRLTDLDASTMTSGTVPSDRLSGDYTGITSISSNRFLGDPNDTASTPSFTWAGSTTMGMYRQSSNEIGISINGTKRLSITSTDVWSPGDIRGFSDERLKRNFVVFSDALARIHQVEGGIYERTDLDGQRQVGVMAQRLKQVVPELVAKNTDGIYGVSYGNFTALLLEAIKEVDNKYMLKIEDLENRLNQLGG